MPRGQVSYTTADDTQAIFGLGIDEDDVAGAEPVADAHVADTTNAHAPAALQGVASALTVTSLDGADETTPPGEIYAVTGMVAADIIIAVLFVSTKASVATIEVLDPADFTPGVDTLTSTDEVDRTNDQLIVIWYNVA